MSQKYVKTFEQFTKLNESSASEYNVGDYFNVKKNFAFGLIDRIMSGKINSGDNFKIIKIHEPNEFMQRINYRVIEFEIITTTSWRFKDFTSMLIGEPYFEEALKKGYIENYVPAKES